MAQVPFLLVIDVPYPYDPNKLIPYLCGTRHSYCDSYRIYHVLILNNTTPHILETQVLYPVVVALPYPYGSELIYSESYVLPNPYRPTNPYGQKSFL